MSTEDQSARLLADWLASPAGTPPPEGLEPEVVAAVYAMRPDRAPAPRVSIDDVFAAVKSGPFASGTSTAEASAPAESARPSSKVRASGAPAARGEGKRKGPSRWWMAPAALASLAAAAFALLIVPLVLVEGTPSDLMRQVAVSQEPAPAAAPMAGGGGAPTGATRDAQGMPLESGAAPAEPPARSMAPEATEQLGYVAADAAPPPPPAEAPVAGATAAPATAPADGGDSLGWPAAEPKAEERLKKEAPLAAEVQATPKTDAAREYSEPVGSLAASPAPAPSPVIAEAESSARDEQDQLVTTSTASSSDSRRESTKAKSTASNAGPTKKPSASAPASQSGGYAASADADDEAGASGARSRSSAAPADYDPNFYAARADVVSAFAAAEALRSSGQSAAAITAYTAWTRDSDPQVAQEAAWRAAKLQRDAGQTSQALSTVSSGLQRSSANTPQRANLLLLRGDLYQSQGRGADAEASWAEAARLNGLR